jgi:DNA recombination protein RmuC
MTPIVTIGTAGFDAVHIVLLLGVLGLGFLAYTLWGRIDLTRRDLTRAEEDLSDTKQALRTKEDVARQAEIALAEMKARSEEDERKFADLAQGVLRTANAQFL